ncbi:hypothetical protein SAMN05445756_1069 [Kytococcus aerolatus]|uniref:Spermidine synthase n=1 Tax=Kytococcus aerolatus TaxID=592308 RepID=A0A212TDV1_9MICO|nr:fused MFS/spermidine synthase [Kytococcus aerolatus]SNC64227.1 hypothetical protein SAMN05445756_1069 [Kytococcus aerolatus]
MPATQPQPQPQPQPQRTLQLSVSGQQARLAPAEHGTGWELFIGPAVQSHVDPASPTTVRYEYLARIAHVLDATAPAGIPLRVLHLGAGALTLPRYVQATRPDSTQTVVDLEPALVGFVLDTLPMPPGTDLTSVVADARAAVAELPDGTWDAVVLDVPSDLPETEHLAGPDFHLELLDLLTEDGVLLVNVGDDDGLAWLATQVESLGEAADALGHDGVWLLADSGMLERRALGNAVLAVGAPLADARDRLVAAGPHPAAVLGPEEAALVERIRAR